METKICSRCKESKPIADFTKGKESKFGYRNDCKKCHNRYNIEIWLKGDSPSAIAERKRRAEYKEKCERRLVEKVCTICKITKTVSDFNVMSKSRNGRTTACKTCTKLIWAKKYAEKGKEINAIRKQKKQKLRSLTLQMYGNMCVCCGESEPQFLAIDHIYNDGAAHRKDIKINGGGHEFYLWLKKNGFPKDRFQLLCHNCNLAKGLYGQCPHKTKEVQI